MTVNLGTFEESVFLAVARLGEEAYRQLIADEVRRSLGRDVASGTVYDALRKLKRQGLLDTVIVASTILHGEHGSHYVLTGEGKRALEGVQDRLAKLNAVDKRIVRGNRFPFSRRASNREKKRIFWSGIGGF